MSSHGRHLARPTRSARRPAVPARDAVRGGVLGPGSPSALVRRDARGPRTTAATSTAGAAPATRRSSPTGRLPRDQPERRAHQPSRAPLRAGRLPPRRRERRLMDDEGRPAPTVGTPRSPAEPAPIRHPSPPAPSAPPAPRRAHHTARNSARTARPAPRTRPALDGGRMAAQLPADLVLLPDLTAKIADQSQGPAHVRLAQVHHHRTQPCPEPRPRSRAQRPRLNAAYSAGDTSSHTAIGAPACRSPAAGAPAPPASALPSGTARPAAPPATSPSSSCRRP
jgi:hypothetical protein